MTGTRVQVVAGGPVLVAGPVRIEMPDGEVVESDRFMVAICTCRRSENYPLCDTSHRRCRNIGRRNVSPAPSATMSDPAATTP
ncbi:CDGSH iron-sulfur domain-containing protein [Mycobacterium paraseoulense]|uniref:Iron-binding protein n=1 Tax=Mycobacterium paraseoulense TaxID=590652 RepID=A0A1X0I830_9MYCO|nr:CDGSH iron-sulfur domain-containing protein [Mycobacterium paraseoulense]ORB37454.1 iron-binding protein [Mycobacterium paraseoulense]BBZ72354.1 hypothetical protein MPRS_34470 [Mycobacterium paraseoulense]